MSKIIGLLLVLGVLSFGAYSYMGWANQVDAPTVTDTVITAEAPLDAMEIEENGQQEADAVEEAVAPSESTDVDAIEVDADIADIEKDLDGLGDLESGLDTL